MAKKKKDNPGKLIDTIVKGIQEKKGNNIICLDMTSLKNSVADYFVICDADNIRQVSAIADSIEDLTMKKAGEKPSHVEGDSEANWVLLDYFNVVAHVFHKEARDFYNLESLWADAKRTEYENN